METSFQKIFWQESITTLLVHKKKSDKFFRRSPRYQNVNDIF